MSSITEGFKNLFSDSPLVDKATADDDAPTPGYLYNDIIRTHLSALRLLLFFVGFFLSSFFL
jgi:hypothetical protein